MRIPFVGPAYQARSLNADAQRAINCYLEMDDASPRAPVALYGTPGLHREFVIGVGPMRGSISQGALSFFVSGNEVIQVSVVGSIYGGYSLGRIGTLSGPVSMASNGTQVLIVDGTGGWIVTIGGNVMRKITDPDFPNGVTQCTYVGGYFVVTGDDSEKFYINQNPGDGTVWNGTDFASAEGSPDNTVGCITNHLELWLFGSNSVEVWINTGNASFPFERSSNVFIEHGCAAAPTVAKMDNTIFWLGQDDRGFGIVWRADGYQPQRVSTHAIERAIQSYPVVSDAFAFTYQQEGHSFYVLTFPSAGKTWCFDIATGQWHERAYMDPATGALTRWRPNCHVFFNNQHLVGDYQTGRVYSLNLDEFTDDGDAILRLRTTQCLDSEQHRLFYSMLQVDMETGVGTATGQGANPQLMMRFSNDGGHSWSNQKVSTVGRTGQYGARAIYRRLGHGRNRVWEISMTDPVKFAVLGGISNYVVGTS